MYTEGQLASSDIDALSADHPFINADLLQSAETLVLLSFAFSRKK